MPLTHQHSRLDGIEVEQAETIQQPRSQAKLLRLDSILAQFPSRGVVWRWRWVAHVGRWCRQRSRTSDCDQNVFAVRFHSPVVAESPLKPTKLTGGRKEGVAIYTKYLPLIYLTIEAGSHVDLEQNFCQSLCVLVYSLVVPAVPEHFHVNNVEIYNSSLHTFYKFTKVHKNE